MDLLKAKSIQCPYCWEMIDIVIDSSVAQQHYIEDCQVCCRPIELKITVYDEDSIDVAVSGDND